MADRPGGGSRGRLTFQWNPAEHATYCPQHNPPPADGGGSSWLCCCSGPLYELRAAARAVIDAEYGSNSWAEAFDVLVDIVAEQERLEMAADLATVHAPLYEQAVARLSGAETLHVHGCILPGDHAGNCIFDIDAERVAAEDRAATVRLYGEEHVARLEREANRGV